MELRVQIPESIPKRTRGISVRLTPEELVTYNTMAHEMGISLNRLVRALLKAQYQQHQETKNNDHKS